VTSNKAVGAVIAIWTFAVLANFAFWGFIIWAIYKLVTHYAG
jgi:hypothetical protein